MRMTFCDSCGTEIDGAKPAFTLSKDACLWQFELCEACGDRHGLPVIVARLGETRRTARPKLPAPPERY